MAEAQAAKAPTTPALGVARIVGRIEAATRKASAGGAFWLTVMKLPAADRFDSPATVEVASGERIGAVGEEVSIEVRIGGYGRSYDSKNEPGVKVRTADNRLTFVSFA